MSRPLTAAAALLLFACTPEAPGVQLARKVVAAYGGEARLRAVKTLQAKRTTTLALGDQQVTLSILDSFRMPRSHRQEVTSGGNVQLAVLTESTAFMVLGDKIQELTAEDAKLARKSSEHDLVPAMRVLRALDDKRALAAGTGTLEGTQYDTIEVRDSDGDVEKLYVDPTTRLLAGFETARQKARILEHRTFEGIVVPTRIRLEEGPRGYEGRVLDVKVDVPLAPALFEKPAAKLPDR